jgi:hypothetical protein
MPIIDIGTLDKIRNGSIKFCDAIDRRTSDSVVFSDGKSEKSTRSFLRSAFARSAPLDA